MAKASSATNMHQSQLNQTTTDGFEQQYLCYPLSESNEFSHHQDGNRIIMPASALSCVPCSNIEYPLIFSIQNTSINRTSYCGVLEFSADEGSVMLPEWMMSNLQLKKGQLVTLKNTSLTKVIQSHRANFIDIPSGPKSVLVGALEGFSCLTLEDTIPTKEVSVVETEFAQPLDDKPPEPPPPPRPPPSQQQQQQSGKMFVPFTGIARRLDGQPASSATPPIKPQAVSAVKETVSSLRPFTGTARRLDEEQPSEHVMKREEEDLSSHLKSSLKLSGKRKSDQIENEGIPKKSRKV